MINAYKIEGENFDRILSIKNEVEALKQDVAKRMQAIAEETEAVKNKYWSAIREACGIDTDEDLLSAHWEGQDVGVLIVKNLGKPSDQPKAELPQTIAEFLEKAKQEGIDVKVINQ